MTVDRDAPRSILGVDWRAAATAVGNERQVAVAVGLCVAIGVAANLANNLWLPEPFYVPVCVVAAAALGRGGTACGRRLVARAGPRA